MTRYVDLLLEVVFQDLLAVVACIQPLTILCLVVGAVKEAMIHKHHRVLDMILLVLVVVLLEEELEDFQEVLAVLGGDHQIRLGGLATVISSNNGEY